MEWSNDAAVSRYCELIERALRASLPGQAHGGEPGGDLRVERGVAYPLLMLPEWARLHWTEREIGALLALSAGDVAGGTKVLDAQGHYRPVYEGLLLYSVFQASRMAKGYWMPDDAERWGELLDARITRMTGWPVTAGGALAASGGAAVAASAWLHLATLAADGSPEDPAEAVEEAFERLALSQRPSGTFLEARADDNPETHWYHELLLLHAAASYAVQARDRRVAGAVARAAEFHLRETQPDHATNQPWALAAFVLTPSARPLADQVLHAASTLGRSGVASILLADALYCLRLWTTSSV